MQRVRHGISGFSGRERNWLLDITYRRGEAVNSGGKPLTEGLFVNRIVVPSLGTTDWRRLLADPIRHWRRSKSAFESAIAWESSKHTQRGLPESIAGILDTNPTTASAELLLAIPELQVDLPPAGHPSQNDVWALLRTEQKSFSMTVEAKSGEPLGPLVKEWLPAPDSLPPSGKPKRLDFLRDCLGLQGVEIGELRYQLLHRAASAIVMAERFGAAAAIMLIHSFGGSDDDKSRDAYFLFGKAMGPRQQVTRSLVCRGQPGFPYSSVGRQTSRPPTR